MKSPAFGINPERHSQEDFITTLNSASLYGSKWSILENPYATNTELLTPHHSSQSPSPPALHMQLRRLANLQAPRFNIPSQRYTNLLLIERLDLLRTPPNERVGLEQVTQLAQDRFEKLRPTNPV